MSHLRYNPILGEFVAIAPARMDRREGAADCAFCADVARLTSGVEAWSRPNDFPPVVPPDGEALMLIYARDHHQTYRSLSRPQLADVHRLWRDTYADLAGRWRTVLIFENSGEEIGQTQAHPHGQAYGLAVTPTRIAREREGIGPECALCREVADEVRGPRLIGADAEWVAYIPPYARYPYQVHLASRAHVPDLLEVAAGPEMARWIQRVVLGWDELFEAPMPYMMVMHQMRDPQFHFHVELLPVRRERDKLKMAASAESGYDFWINDSLPEEAAARLRPLVPDRTPQR